MVEDPDREIRAVLKAVDVPWDDAVLKFYASNRTVHTHSQSRECEVAFVSGCKTSSL